jgi:DNA-binding transcriptional ArsR family regulator
MGATMPRTAVQRVLLFKQRHAMAETFIHVIESCRDDYFPGETLENVISFVLIIEKMTDINEVGREATASALSRSIGIPRATLRRKLVLLTRLGLIDQRRSRYVISPGGLNHPLMLQGYKDRLTLLANATKKMVKMTD